MVHNALMKLLKILIDAAFFLKFIKLFTYLSADIEVTARQNIEELLSFSLYIC